MPCFKNIAYIVLILLLMLIYPFTDVAESVIYSAEVKPFGDGISWSRTIPESGGAIVFDLDFELEPETIKAEVTAEINFDEKAETVTVRGTGGILASDALVNVLGTLNLDFTLPLAFWEEDSDVHIKHSLAIPDLTKVDGWNESTTFDSFLLDDSQVSLEGSVRDLLTKEFSTVDLAFSILSGPIPSGVIGDLFKEIIKEHLDAGIKVNGGVVSYMTMTGTAVVVNGTSITSENQTVSVSGEEITSSYEEDFRYGLDAIISCDVYAHIGVLGIEIWSYTNALAETRISIIDETRIDLPFSSESTKEEEPEEPEEPEELPTDPQTPSGETPPGETPAGETPPGATQPTVPSLTGIVWIPDPHLEQAVRRTLNLSEPDEDGELPPIMRRDMLRLTEIGAYRVKRLTGLEYALNLQTAHIMPFAGSLNLAPLSGLTDLHRLVIYRGSDITLSGLVNIKRLSFNRASGYVVVSGLTNLEQLVFQFCDVSNVSVSELTNLENLYLTDTDISNLKFSGVPNMSFKLDISGNRASNLAISGFANTNSTLNIVCRYGTSDLTISGLTQLESLVIGHWDATSDLTILGLTQVQSLSIYAPGPKDPVSEVSSLTFSELTEVTNLNIEGDPISNVSSLAFPALTQVFTLNISGNAISDLPSLVPLLSGGLTHLIYLTLYKSGPDPYRNSSDDYSDMDSLIPSLILPSLAEFIPLSKWIGLLLIIRDTSISTVSVLFGGSGDPPKTEAQMESRILSAPPLHHSLPGPSTDHGHPPELAETLPSANHEHPPDLVEIILPPPPWLSVGIFDANGWENIEDPVTFTVAQEGETLGNATAIPMDPHAAVPLPPFRLAAGEYTVTVASPGIATPVTFTAVTIGNLPVHNPMDVNGDGIINIQDLVLVSSSLGQTGENEADVNGDGVVNIQDLVLVSAALQ